MKTFAVCAASALALSLATPASAQDSSQSDETANRTGPGSEMSSQAELVGNMGKVEANIAESQARLFTHMLLPQDDPERAAYAQAFEEDLASVDDYLSEVQESDLPEGASDEIERFAAQWSSVKELANGLTGASRDDLASVEDIKAYSAAVLELDDYIDAALVAAGLPDDDDGPESGAAGSGTSPTD